MRHTTLAALSLVVCAALAAPAGVPVRADEPKVYKGVIQRVTAGENGPAILVEQMGNGHPERQILFHLRKETKIDFSDKRKAALADLKVGGRVSVTFTGALDLSLPPQGAALRIVIERAKKAK